MLCIVAGDSLSMLEGTKTIGVVRVTSRQQGEEERAVALGPTQTLTDADRRRQMKGWILLGTKGRIKSES
jgi:hypothetical protein